MIYNLSIYLYLLYLYEVIFVVHIDPNSDTIYYL